MIKSRRAAALQSRELSQAGCALLQIDLLGCSTLTRRDGHSVHVRKASRPEPRHQTIDEILGEVPGPGGTHRTVMQRCNAVAVL